MGGGVPEYLSGDVLWFQRHFGREERQRYSGWMSEQISVVEAWFLGQTEAMFKCFSAIWRVVFQPCLWSSCFFWIPRVHFHRGIQRGWVRNCPPAHPAFSLPSLAETVPIRKDVCALVTKSLQIESLSKGKCRTILQINLGTREYRPCVKLGWLR